MVERHGPARGSPSTELGACTEPTMIDRRLSRASAKAAVSITLRSRAIASSWVRRSIAHRVRIRLRIGRIDAVDLRRLQHRVAAQLGRAQHRGGVGGEERIAGAAGEHHHLALARGDGGRAGGHRSRRSTASTPPTWSRADTPAALSARLERERVHHGRRACPWNRPSARSIQPAALMRAPRMMLPPPITTAISNPARGGLGDVRGKRRPASADRASSRPEPSAPRRRASPGCAGIVIGHPSVRAAHVFSTASHTKTAAAKRRRSSTADARAPSGLRAGRRRDFGGEVASSFSMPSPSA